MSAGLRFNPQYRQLTYPEDVGSDPTAGPPGETDRGVEGWRHWCPPVRWAAGVGCHPEDLTLPQSSGGGNESA